MKFEENPSYRPEKPEKKLTDDESEDQDEVENEQLEASFIQKLLSPMYLVILLIGVVVASVPFLILITIGWTIMQATERY